MSALVKSRLVNYLRVVPLGTVEAHATRSGMGVQLVGGEAVTASGENAGSLIEDGVIKANQKVLIQMGTIAPKKFHALIEVHPDLYLNGTVGCTRMAEPDDKVDLVINFRADRQVDLKQLPWTMRLYLLD